ncbi:ATP-dependent DNA helicase DDX11 [Scaptodrosophila lebanonensis]|uniref:DNA 5'-3' helicase n=1 Tax=Drosophila lebanonensis TaxID=7225 RepID=A0A6J2TWA3_DROLE|nr:ATP-dependent DNA helicase DDX11 [Scaptodrosophila lebanonensis]
MASYSPRKKLPAPADFGFPYTPYDIQQDLMQQLFLVLERKQIGIFESPTGTGKSLTLTCGALTWLQQHEQLVREELLERIELVERELRTLQAASAQANDWIAAQGATQVQRQELQQLQRLRTLLQQRERELEEIRQRKATQKQQFRPARKAQDHYESVDLPVDAMPASDDDEEAEVAEEEQPAKDQEERYRDVQIFYCSRTHSQLAQIVAELRKTPHGRHVRCVTLGSRQQLCINDQVRRLSSVALMNERCLDMARIKQTANPSKKPRLSSSTASSLGRCNLKAPALLQTLSDVALCEPLDIEELAAQGAACGACPYYAARSAQTHAQLVLLPYPLLLQRSARQQNSIDLHGAIIIVDEAHNLLDTIAQLHSAELTLEQLQLARDQILAYKQRYARRLSTSNMLCINQLLYVVKRLLKLLEIKTEDEPRMLRTYDLASEGDFYNIDLYALLRFCTRTRFAQKLHGFGLQQQREPRPSENRPPSTLQLLHRLATQHQQQSLSGKLKLNKQEQDEDQEQEQTPPIRPTSTPSAPTPSPIRPLLAFLETLTSDAADGRVLLNPRNGNMKYLLLNPAEHFEDIVREARALIIAGGTMQPTQELTTQLFGNYPERVVQHFYSHVVPDDAVLPFVVTTGPTGAPLCFNYTQRASLAMLNELAMVLQNLCGVLPAGLVCFLPSYDYLETVYVHLEKCGALERIGQRKRVFRETAGGGGVEQLLQQYAEAIKQSSKGNGALLLSVVGGKLSEGLNFADDLGRGVIVVGLPYPNRQSPELQERMRHLDSNLGTGAGNEYYENLCMKAVNQCIGRSVRHIRDFACVYLLDERYGNARIQQKLPAWISRHIVEATATTGGFGGVQARTARFFKLARN